MAMSPLAFSIDLQGSYAIKIRGSIFGITLPHVKNKKIKKREQRRFTNYHIILTTSFFLA